MEVECNPKRFNWICVTGSPLYVWRIFSLFHQQSASLPSEFLPGVKVGSGSVRMPS